MTAAELASTGRQHIVILITRPTRPARQDTLFRLALWLSVAPEGHIQEAIHKYHERLGEVLTVPWHDLIPPADDLVSTLTELSRGANLVMLGVPSHRFTW